MKADEDVKMISAEAPVLFAKACEMFIIELTHRSYYHTIENKRKTLQRSDIAQTIASTDIYDFLQDIIPKEELREAQQSNQKAQEELNLKLSNNTNVAPQTQQPQDILAGGPSMENTPQVKPEEQLYLQPSKVNNESGDKEMQDPAGHSEAAVNATNMFKEIDPTNLNENELNTGKKQK